MADLADTPKVEDASSDEEAEDVDHLLEQEVEAPKDANAGKKTTARLEESSGMRRELNRLKSTRFMLEDDPEAHPWFKERECLLLLLEARMLLKEMVHLKLKQERIKNGDLSASEIQNLLRSQKEEQETDWITEIQELKRNLVSEVRRNHVLERELNKLDKRIALLIKNRGNIQEVMVRHDKKGKHAPVGKAEFISDTRKLEHYQNLFYLLQTEPKYLANLVYLMNAENMTSFLDTVIITLYGDAFSPREEYLILRLLQLAIQREMSASKDVAGFLQADSVVPKMLMSYNQRKQGLDFLKALISPLMKSVNLNDINLEIKPSLVYSVMINEAEINSGQKSNLDRNLPEEQILENPEVKEILRQRTAQLAGICQQFADAFFASLNKFPYGIRWICKQIRLIAQEKFSNSNEKEVLKFTAYFIYYRFINLAIVTPERFGILDREPTPQGRKNCLAISRVLQSLFNLQTFKSDGAEKAYLPLNGFINQNVEAVREFYNDLIEVADPDDYLQVDKYMELTQKTKPVIIISINEIAQTHQFLAQSIDKLAKDKEDPLRQILNDLGEAPAMCSKEDDREIQLTLTNRFKQNMEEEISASASLYAETKELIISTFRLIPVQGSDQDQTLLGILNSGRKYAKEKGNNSLGSQIEKILENIKTLEAEGLISKLDNYASFLRDIALEVANRAQIREQQRKEIKRLTATLKNLRKHQKYLNEQIQQYNNYLQDCRLKHYQPKTKKKSKSNAENPNKIGPFKFSYGALQKKGVIIDSDVPALSRKKTVFYISSEEVGVFDIVAKIAGLPVEKMTLELDDLLERNYNNMARLELDQVTLDVNFTIHLINKFFLK